MKETLLPFESEDFEREIWKKYENIKTFLTN